MPSHKAHQLPSTLQSGSSMLSFIYLSGEVDVSYPVSEEKMGIFISANTYVSDKELFNGLKTGNRQAILSIYEVILPKVKSWILSNNGSSADARDIFQETLETILLKIDNCDNLGGMVMTIAKRRWIDRLRKKGTMEKMKESLKTLSHEEDASASYDKYQLMEQTFSQLSELCQKVITYIKEGKSVEEIVRKLEMKSANTMYRRKAACVERWSVLVKNNENYKEIFD